MPPFKILTIYLLQGLVGHRHKYIYIKINPISDYEIQIYVFPPLWHTYLSILIVIRDYFMCLPSNSL